MRANLGPMRPCSSRIALLAMVAFTSVGCVSDMVALRWRNHGDLGVWGDAVAGTADDAYQWGTAAVLAAAIPIADANDTRWSDSAIDRTLFSSHQSDGDRVLQGLMGAAGGVAIGEWLLGDDHGLATETLVESMIVTGGIVQWMKSANSRRRPRGSGSFDSFPSGHATAAWVSATFLARRIDDSFDDWRGNLGYLTYVPAALVMLNRVENARHYPSDVAVGALLGSMITNIIYNAHYPGDGRRGLNGKPPISFVASVDDDWAGIYLQYRF